MGNVSEDFLQFSRIELLHHLRDAHVFHDEEDESISAIFHNRRVNIDLNSIHTCKQQVATPITGAILVFPRIQPSGLGRVYSRQTTASVNCECLSS